MPHSRPVMEARGPGVLRGDFCGWEREAKTNLEWSAPETSAQARPISNKREGNTSHRLLFIFLFASFCQVAYNLFTRCNPQLASLHADRAPFVLPYWNANPLGNPYPFAGCSNAHWTSPNFGLGTSGRSTTNPIPSLKKQPRRLT